MIGASSPCPPPRRPQSSTGGSQTLPPRYFHTSMLPLSDKTSPPLHHPPPPAGGSRTLPPHNFTLPYSPCLRRRVPLSITRPPAPLQANLEAQVAQTRRLMVMASCIFPPVRMFAWGLKVRSFLLPHIHTSRMVAWGLKVRASSHTSTHPHIHTGHRNEAASPMFNPFQSRLPAAKGDQTQIQFPHKFGQHIIPV